MNSSYTGRNEILQTHTHARTHVHTISTRYNSCLRQKPQWQRCFALCNFRLTIKATSVTGGPVTEKIRCC